MSNKWLVSLVEAPINNPYREDYFPRSMTSEKWVMQVKKIIEEAGGTVKVERKPRFKCGACGQHKAQELHFCPYKRYVLGDEETLCDCCKHCTEECASD